MTAGSPDPAGDAAHDRAARRRRLAEVFGEVLPETTADEHDAGDAGAEADGRERWYREQVPPHHG